MNNNKYVTHAWTDEIVRAYLEAWHLARISRYIYRECSNCKTISLKPRVSVKCQREKCSDQCNRGPRK